METLATQYSKHGYDYKQVERSNKVAIYEQSFEGQHVAFEVFLIKKEKERNIMGKKYPPAEVPPATEKWGTYGFTCRSLERARTRMADLEKSKFGEANEK